MNPVWGVCMVRDAEDIIGPIVEHMLEQVDAVLVADNLSTDNTRRILENLKLKYSTLAIIDDNNPAYLQSKKMTHLANVARLNGAHFVIPFDADEWWYPVGYSTIKDMFNDNNEYDIFPAYLYDHVPTGKDDTAIENPIDRINYRRVEKGTLHKVGVKASDTLTIQMGNHNAIYSDREALVLWDKLEIRHFPYRSAKQFVDKAVVGGRALEQTSLPYEMGQHWREYKKIHDRHGPEALERVFTRWFYEQDPDANSTLVFDPTPRVYG